MQYLIVMQKKGGSFSMRVSDAKQTFNVQSGYIWKVIDIWFQKMDGNTQVVFHRVIHTLGFNILWIFEFKFFFFAKLFGNYYSMNKKRRKMNVFDLPGKKTSLNNNHRYVSLHSSTYLSSICFIYHNTIYHVSAICHILIYFPTAKNLFHFCS